MNKKLNTTFKQYMFFEDKSMMTMHSVQQYLTTGELLFSK